MLSLSNNTEIFVTVVTVLSFLVALSQRKSLSRGSPLRCSPNTAGIESLVEAAVGPARPGAMRRSLMRSGLACRPAGRSVIAVTRPTKMAAIGGEAHLYFIIIPPLPQSISRAAAPTAFDTRRRNSITVFTVHHINIHFEHACRQSYQRDADLSCCFHLLPDIRIFTVYIA